MDPKHGEISRAMRNRGIEIFVCGDVDDIEGYSEFDVKRLMHELGLIGKMPCELLLEIHNQLNSLVPASSKHTS